MESLKPMIKVKDCLEWIDHGVEHNYVKPYELVEMMSPSLRESLGDALYAYSANMDALTTQQEEGLDEMTMISQGMGGYD